MPYNGEFQLRRWYSVDDFGKNAVKNHPVIDRLNRRKSLTRREIASVLRLVDISGDWPFSGPSTPQAECGMLPATRSSPN
jgi:hypothetical protein